MQEDENLILYFDDSDNDANAKLDSPFPSTDPRNSSEAIPHKPVSSLNRSTWQKDPFNPAQQDDPFMPPPTTTFPFPGAEPTEITPDDVFSSYQPSAPLILRGDTDIEEAPRRKKVHVVQLDRPIIPLKGEEKTSGPLTGSYKAMAQTGSVTELKSRYQQGQRHVTSWLHKLPAKLSHATVTSDRRGYTGSLITEPRSQRLSMRSLLLAIACGFMIAILLGTFVRFANVLASPQTHLAHSTTKVHLNPTPTPALPANFGQMLTVLQMQNRLLFHGTPRVPEVALTFDDGPSIYTPQILNILQQNGLHATFFCIGKNVQQYPGYVTQEARAGMVIGNHSWDHPDMVTLSPAALQDEITRTSQVIQQATGQAPTLLRPPYGSINASVLQNIYSQGLTTALWDVDAVDWKIPGVTTIVQTVLAEVANSGNGSIILMHDGGGDRTQTIAALPIIIQALKQRGYSFVTLTQMVQDLQKMGGNTPTSTMPEMQGD